MPSVPPGQSTVKTLEIGYSDTLVENSRKIYSLFFDGTSSLTLPSSLVYIVQGGASPFAALFAVSFTPGLYKRRFCHVLNLTGLSVLIVLPDAVF
jgi:hypothetical protein